jgi:hypothetical protein
LTGILLQEEERRENMKPLNKYLALWSNNRFAREIKRKRQRMKFMEESQFIVEKTIPKAESGYAI